MADYDRKNDEKNNDENDEPNRVARSNSVLP
jgi:hypothetical protein